MAPLWHGISPHIQTASSYQEIAHHLPETADALIILPHDALIDYHLQLHSLCEKRGIPAIVCNHGATHMKSSALAYGPHLREFGQHAGQYVAHVLKEDGDVPGEHCDVHYTVSTR